MIRRSTVCFAVPLLVAMAGCRHRPVKPQAILVTAPDIRPAMVSVPPPTHPSEPLPVPEKPVVVEVAPPPPPPKKIRKKRPAAVAATPPAAAAPTQVATAEPAISLGQLSAGGDSGTALRSETEQMMAAQKQRLDRLPPPLVSAHATEAEQVRRFLKGSETAWEAGDVEGAHTLALKAKILLDDLLH